MALSLRRLDCCAIREIDGIRQQDPKSTLNKIRSIVFDITGYCFEPGVTHNILQPFILFSDTTAMSNDGVGGYAFAKFIQDEGLGKLVKTAALQNWTTAFVKVWIWQVDFPALRAYYKKLDKAAIKAQQMAREVIDAHN